MKITNCKFTNFGSYPELSINLEDMGLALIQGRTGAGKSTIMDAVQWGLYGVTAKDGKADDIRPWQDSGETTSEIEVETPTAQLKVTRIRGTSSSVNDLYFTENGRENLIRGKDSTETQKLICAKLGVDSNTFVAGSYYNEFSPTGAFFTSKAKDRRDLFEKLANLELPNRLNLRSQELKKSTKAALATEQQEHAKLSGKYDQNIENLESAIENFEKWEIQRAKTSVHLEKAIVSYEEDKAQRIKDLEEELRIFELRKELIIKDYEEKIKAIQHKIKPQDYFRSKIKELEEKQQDGELCPTCGQQSEEVLSEIQAKRQILMEEKSESTHNENYVQIYKENIENTKKSQTLLPDKIKAAKEEVSTHKEQLLALKNSVNPWAAEQEKLANNAVDLNEKVTALKLKLTKLEERLYSLSTLNDLAAELRGELLKNAVTNVQDLTNSLLTKYFDAEITVSLEPNGSDDLTVTIHKSGHECSYKQLSKGQRGLLKLCFSAAVMQSISSSAGVEFNNLFLDESLDGLDSDLKIKAFALFQSLTANSILIIDHAPEFQNLFDKRFEVTMQGDVSTLNEKS